MAQWVAARRGCGTAPSNGTAYEPADLTAFQDLLRTRRSSNLKVIGVGAGATFVNSVIAKYAFAVAGILTYGGTVDKGVTSSIPVPAYVHASDCAVTQLYIAANGATAKIDDSQAFTTYANPKPHAGLQRVVVSKLPDGRETSQRLSNACILSAPWPAANTKGRQSVDSPGALPARRVYSGGNIVDRLHDCAILFEPEDGKECLLDPGHPRPALVAVRFIFRKYGALDRLPMVYR